MSNYSPSGPTREQLIELAEMYGTADHSLDWDSSGNLVGPGVQYWPSPLDYEGEVLRRKLFGQGQQGLVFVPQPKVLGEQELYKLDDFTGPVTANGDPVGGGQEVSGNGNHLTQSVSADRPTYNTDGSLHWLGFDGVGDYLKAAKFATAKTMMLVLRRKTLDRLVVLSYEGSRYIFAIEKGITSANMSSGAGTPTFYIDNTQVLTRDEAHNATSDLGWHILEVHDAETSGWVEIKIGGYSDTSYQFGMDVSDILVFDGVDTEARDRARQYLANKHGITL